MEDEKELTAREYLGVVLADNDPSHQGLYKVHVPELQPHLSENDGIWAKNHVTKYRVSPSEDGVCGSYYPLHAGMAVVIKCLDNQIESAYIDRIVSDSYPESLPYQTTDRDNFYQLIRTPKYNNLIAIYEGSSDFPANSMHFYYNATQTIVVIDQTGISIKSANNLNITISQNCKITVVGNTDLKTTGTTNVESTGDMNIKSSGNTNIQATTVNIKGTVNVGPTVNLGIDPSAASSATAADEPNAIDVSKDYPYFKRNRGN